MKNIKILLITLTMMTIMSSCEDPLERTSVGIFSEENVWTDEGLVDLYVANVFARTNFLPGAGNGNIHELVVDACAGGYARTFGGWPAGYTFTQGAFSSQGTGNDSREDKRSWTCLY